METRETARTLDDIARDFDVLLARHEDQDVARRVRDVDLERLLDGRVDIVLARRLAEEDVDGEGATRDREAGGVVVEARELAWKAKVSRLHGVFDGELDAPWQRSL